jgi:hypothetical protein
MPMGQRDLRAVHSGEQNHDPYERKAHTTTAKRRPALLSHGEGTL